MKVPDGVQIHWHARTPMNLHIGRANQYEQVGQKPGLRMLAAIAGARRAEQSTFILGMPASAGMWVL